MLVKTVVNLEMSINGSKDGKKSDPILHFFHTRTGKKSGFPIPELAAALTPTQQEVSLDLTPEVNRRGGGLKNEESRRNDGGV